MLLMFVTEQEYLVQCDFWTEEKHFQNKEKTVAVTMKLLNKNHIVRETVRTVIYHLYIIMN